MGRGERAGSKNSSKGQAWKRSVNSDDSDEDYMLEEDELDDQSDDQVSLVGDASDEESLGSFEDEEEEIVRKAVGSKSQKRSMVRRKNGTKSSKKRKRLSYDEEDDEDYHDGDDEDDYNDDGDDEDDYNDGGDEEEDDEFTPDELDFLDKEEEVPSPKVKNKKKGRQPLKKKGSRRGQNRKTSKRLLKKPPKKKGKGSTRSSKSTSVKSRTSMQKVLSSRGKHKRMPIRKKQKAVQCSDPDFVSSESSDYEFTISEEEREQVREADEFCGRLSPNLRSSTKDQEYAAHNQLKNLPTRKGKEKVEDIKADVGKQVCGICLTEEGKNTVRGTLDCCSHFFCFACIIEWSKVESRCPLCKQRFSTISKPAKSANRIDLRNEVIHVPERDQVYQPSEEELRDYLDPYQNMICTECHEGRDDALMLLCDLCDSPAHTYCVGLGREVPEGNWYCEVCRPSALGSTSSQAQDLTPVPRANNSALNEPSMFENMAEIDLNITIPETPMTPVNGFLGSPRQPSSGSLRSPVPVSGVGVSTVSGRRRVHRLQFLNRLSHMARRIDRTSSSDRRTNFSGSWEDRSAQSAHLETNTTDVGRSYLAEYMDRLQAVQNRESFPTRPSLLRGQVLQVPSAVDSSAFGFMQLGGAGGINLGVNCIPSREFLQPRTSRLNLGSGTSMSPLYDRDVNQNASETTTIIGEKPTDVQRYGLGT